MNVFVAVYNGFLMHYIRHMEPLTRNCMECNKALKGRTDKKFCDDFCRNAYNNRQNSDSNNYVRNINNCLRKNRRILESVIKPRREPGKCPKRRLSDQGFDFRYHTHQQLDRNGQKYNFCYEYGYLSLDEDWVRVVRRNSTEKRRRQSSAR